MVEGKRIKQRIRGQQAKRVFESEIVREFFDQCRSEVRRAWEKSAVDETQLREDAWHMQQAIDRLEACFRSTIANGEYAAQQLLKPKQD